MGQRTSWQVPGNNITGNCLRKWHGRPAQDAGSLARWSHAGHAHIQARDQDGGGGFRRFILACGPPVLPQLHLQRRGWGFSLRTRETTEASSVPSSARKGAGLWQPWGRVCAPCTRTGPGTGSIHHQRVPFHHRNEDEMGITALRCYKTKTKGPPWWSRG